MSLLSFFASVACASSFNVATFDGPVDLGARGVAPFVHAPTLRRTELLGVDLERSNHASSDGHGTAVATRLLRDLPPDRVRLLPIPVAGRGSPGAVLGALATMLALEIAPTRTLDKLSARAAEVLSENLDRLLTEHEVRVVNVSLGFDVEDQTLGQFWSHRRAARALRAAHAERLNRLIARHPETLFVLAAGNEGRDLTHGAEPSLSTADHPNVVVVGAHLGARLGPARWSNRSKAHVDVFADGRSEDHEGTSISAPAFANTLVTTWLAHPRWTAARVKAQVLDVACAHGAAYVECARLGRVLPAAGFGEPVVPTYALRFSAGRDDARTHYDLDALVVDDYEHLRRAQGLRWGARMSDPVYRAKFLMLRQVFETMATPPLAPRRERERFAEFLAGPASHKRVIAYAADGSRILGGVMIRGLEVLALDHASMPLVDVVTNALCANRLYEPYSASLAR